MRAVSSLALAAGVAQAAGLLLRPRSGLVQPVPVAATDHFTVEEIERARAYRRPQLALGLAASAAEAAALVALVRRRPRRPSARPVAGAAGAGALTSVLLALAPLPVAAAARRRSLRAGLSTDSWSRWAGDVAKATGIGAAVSGAGAALAVGLMRRRGEGWWAPAAALAVAAGAGVTFAGPVLLDPLFNDFTPLPHGERRQAVIELARQAGVEVGEVYEVDASRRTSAGNAYVTGLGATKRVVLYDTLLDGFEAQEVRLVVAHELGHLRHRDTLRRLAFMALVAPATLRAAAALTGRLCRSAGPETVPALALALGVAGVPAGLASTRLSRRVEARTDAFALVLTGDSEAFVSFQRRIALRNLADPDPPRWLQALAGTHPSTVERIGIAKALAR